MVYVDAIFIMPSKNRKAFNVGKRHDHKWCHLWADSLGELMAFAGKIGLNSDWMQNESGRFPHFDIVPTYRRKAIESGAVEMSFKEYLKKNMCHAGKIR